MKDVSSKSPFAVAQELGGAAEQTDRIRAGVVRTANGQRVLLAAVADGERGANPGEAAGRVVEQVFQAVERARAQDLSAALRRGLEIAGQSLAKRAEQGPSPTQVSVAAVAIWKGRLFYAHAGRVVAIRVAGGRATRLFHPTERRLGPSAASAFSVSPPQGVPLERGDRVVLASDGILRINPETIEPFVLPTEIAQYASELSPTDAARHLVSIALGRDVDDNVSVAVLSLPGARRSTSRRPLAAVLAAGTVLVLSGLAAAVWLARGRAPVATDYGFAVLVAGGVQADSGDGVVQSVANLGTIPASSLVTASTEARLSLQSTFVGGSDLAEGSLYLKPDALVELAALDPRVAADDPARQSDAGRTDLRLLEGKLLVLRESGTREYRIHGAGVTVSLIGAGRGAMGVEVSGGQFRLACLLGACRMSTEAGEEYLLQAGEGVSAVESMPSEITTIPQAANEDWNQLCGGCVGGA